MSLPSSLDRVDIEVASIALEFYIKRTLQRWSLLDRLYADRFYCEQELARQLNKDGRLDNDSLQRSWDDIDRRMAMYDDSCLGRYDIKIFLYELSKRFRAVVRRLREEEISAN